MLDKSNNSHISLSHWKNVVTYKNVLLYYSIIKGVDIPLFQQYIKITYVDLSKKK